MYYKPIIQYIVARVAKKIKLACVIRRISNKSGKARGWFPHWRRGK